MTVPEWLEGHFPDTHLRAAGWKPVVVHRALAMRVLCVATTRIEGEWCAYCNAVPGMRHDHEYQAVLDHGDKLAEEVALVLFPQFGGVPYAR